MTIYITDGLGILTGPVEIPVIPGLGVQLPSNAIHLATLPEPSAGHVWALRDGSPRQLRDQRGTYYRTATGERVEHVELGDLPEGLTTEPRPSQFHAWDGSGWALDEAEQLDAALMVERVWRNGRITATDYLAMPDYPLTESRRAELYAYRQALRDWPQADAFPKTEDRPEPPNWFL